MTTEEFEKRTIDLYNLIERLYGYKVQMVGASRKNFQVSFILYDSFYLKAGFDEPYGTFGAGIEIANEVMNISFLGKTCSLNSDDKSIKQSLQIIDDYCRLRLPDKFLEAYDKAYKENGHKMEHFQ